MILKGKIQRILPMQQGTSKAGNNWQKVEFIVEEDAPQYPDTLCISAMNDHVQELLGLAIGDYVEVDFACRCNEYNGRVYNSLSLFKITKIGSAQAAQTAQQQQPVPPVSIENIMAVGDDLPF